MVVEGVGSGRRGVGVGWGGGICFDCATGRFASLEHVSTVIESNVKIFAVK